ncbi:MAG TPA: CYTH domain-containing protein [Planctomycetota bacterium]|nr:CYTH domain-containing protein [Planctomycetota bacterium]
MPTEIEHKFLVRRERLPRRLPAGERMIQGYLSLDPAVRVRLITKNRRQRAFLTIKGKGLRVRAEFEYPLPVADAKKLLKLCGNRLIEKTRRRFGPVELDEFHGKLAGLWIAEIELPSAQAKLPALPDWIGHEVTDDPRYTNVKLALEMKAPFRMKR